MRALRLHARRWYGPHTAGRVDLRPLGTANLAPPGRRQHEQLESQSDDRSRARSPDGLNRGRHVLMGQCPHVLDGRPLRPDNPCDRLGGVLGPQQNLVQQMSERPISEGSAVR